VPIDAPNLDDLSYAEIVERAKQLIPVYCPEWTNFNDSDPGITLVQLFAWMTEMVIYRLNRVPDATYIHFLNFIGERQGSALPSSTLVSFQKINDSSGPVRVPKLTEVATQQTEDVDEVRFITVRDLTVCGPRLERIIGLKIEGESEDNREVLAIERIIDDDPEHPPVYELGEAAGETAGVPLLEPDPDRNNLSANIYDQFLYLGHNLIERLHTDDQVTLHVELKGNEQGKLFDLQKFFRWEHRVGDEWVAWPDSRNLLAAGLEPQAPIADWDDKETELVTDGGRNLAKYWVRGALEFEKYYLELIREHPKGRFRPRRGDSHPMELLVSATGPNTMEFRFSEPIRPGRKEAFIIRFPRLSLRVAPTYVPGQQWFYFTEDGRWAELPERNLQIRGLDAWIHGPLPADCATPARFQTTRIRAVDIAALTDEGELVVSLERQIRVDLLKGPDINRLERTSLESPPVEPYSNSEFSIAPAENHALYLGADVFEDTVERIGVEFSYFFKNYKFPRAGEWGLEDDLDRYSFKLQYRAKSRWRDVKLEDDEGKAFTEFCFSHMQPSFSEEDQFFTVRMSLQPAKQFKGIAQVALQGTETYWLRLVLVNCDLTDQVEVNVGETREAPPEETKKGAKPKTPGATGIFVKRDLHYHPQIFGIRIQHRGGGKRRKKVVEGEDWYRHVLHDFEALGVNLNRNNPRFTSIRPLVSRSLTSKKATRFPWIAPVETNRSGRSIYLCVDRPLPVGEEVSIYFRMTGEPLKGAERNATWEYLDGERWLQLRSLPTTFDFRGSGFLRVVIPARGEGRGGNVRWLRCKLPDAVKRADGTWGPIRYPRLTHVLLNAAEVSNLQRRELEKFSAYGIPNQEVQLLHQPAVVPSADLLASLPEDLHKESFVEVDVSEGDSQRIWEFSLDDDLRDADRNDRVYAVDPVRGVVRFGDGVHGAIPKAGTHNLVVGHYFTTDGSAGNVPATTIAVCPTYGSQVRVSNPFASTGGRDVESIDDLIKRAPKALTGRTRAVTTEDFEVIAKEASGTLARCHAYKDPGDDPWVVRLTVLPKRDQKTGEIPDAEEIGLLRVVQEYVQERALINTEVRVQMAQLVPVTVDMRCLLIPRTNPSGVRERAEAWIARFLDPFTGGGDGAGWPFGEVPRAQDLQHILKEIPEIRHVEECRVMRAPPPGAPAGYVRDLPRHGRPGQLFVLAGTRERPECAVDLDSD